MFVESTAGSRESPLQGDETQDAGDNVYYGAYADGSIPTSELPSTVVNESTATSDPVMAVNSNIPPPYGPYQEHDKGMVRGRPGWRTPVPAMARYPQYRGCHSVAICHECYEKGHIAPRCTLRIQDRTAVTSNYEKLSDLERARVPANAYMRARATFMADVSMVDPGPPATVAPNLPLPTPQKAERHPVAMGLRTPQTEEQSAPPRQLN